LLLLFFSKVIKNKLTGKEKPHAGKPQPAWGTWERIIKVLEFGKEYSLHLGLRASQEHHQGMCFCFCWFVHWILLLCF
jgi:hypothetical protein